MDSKLLESIRSEFRAWTDGHKQIFVHSANQMPVINLAREENVEVLVSTPVLTVATLENKTRGTFIIFIDRDDEEQAALFHSLRYSHLDLRIISV